MGRKNVLDVVERIGKDTSMVRDPITIFILEERNVVPTSPIKNQNMVKFGIHISFVKPVYTGTHTPMAIFNFKMIIIFRSKIYV